jgi:hypothetical protein
MQTTLFWMREPNVHPPRWSMLIATDRTPAIPVPPRQRFWPWITLLLLPFGWRCWRRRPRVAVSSSQTEHN